MTKLKEALSRSSEKDIKFSNQYLEELHRDQLGSKEKTKTIKEKVKGSKISEKSAEKSILLTL